MGLSESRESNKGLGSAIWGYGGPSKSRSTPHFPGDDRDFRGGRNASTLPARTTPEEMHNYNSKTRTPAHEPRMHEDCHYNPTAHRDGKQVVRSPSLRPVPSRRSASADRRKRRSDPLLEVRAPQPTPQPMDVINYHQTQFYNNSTSPTHSSPSSPKVTHRPRPTAIYIADDQAQRVVERARGRNRRSHAASQPSGSPIPDRNDISKPSRRTRHLSTLTMTPQCTQPNCNMSQRPEHSLSPKQSRRRKKSGGGRRSNASEILQGDPYVSLHYGDESTGHRTDSLQSPTQVTAWRSDQDGHIDMGQKMAQVVIRMEGCTTTTLDRNDIANANIESVEVRKNVWFQATTSERDRFQQQCLDNDWYSVNNDSAKSNKVSSLYMVPDYHDLPIQGNVATIRPRHIRDDTLSHPRTSKTGRRVRTQSPVRPLPPRVPVEIQQIEPDCGTSYDYKEPRAQYVPVERISSYWHQEPEPYIEDILDDDSQETFTPPPPPFNSPSLTESCAPDDSVMVNLECATDNIDNTSSGAVDSADNHTNAVDSNDMCALPCVLSKVCDDTLLTEEPCSVHCGSGDSGFGDASGDSGDAFLPRNYQLVKRYLLDPMILPGEILVPPLLDHPLLQPRQENISCRAKSLSLPRRLQKDRDDPNSPRGMKGFRSRLRSLDLGDFPVLRLPVRDQPKLVDVLKAAQEEEEARQACREAHREVSEEKVIENDSESSSNESSPDKMNNVSESDTKHCESENNEASTIGQSNSDTEGRPHLAVRESCAALLKPDIPWQPVPPSYSLYSHLVPEEPSPTEEKDFPESKGSDTIIPALSRGLGPHGRPSRRGKRPSLKNIAWDSPTHSPSSQPTSPRSPPTTPPFSPTDCDYTCHEQCQELVTLDCKTKLTPDSQSSQEEPFVESCEDLPLSCQINQLETLEHDTGQQDNEEEDEKLYEDASNEKSEYDNVVKVEEVEAEEEKHEEEQQEKDLPPEDREQAQQKELLTVSTVDSNKMNEYMSTLRKKVNSLQSQLVTNDTLEAWVQHYNATAQGLQIAKENDGSYRGCIRVHLNLSRPINIVAGTRPPSIYDILQEDRTMEKTLTSFYMPRDCVKAIHITSKTTTREVIVALLRKFKVVDNPQKFALYERTYETQNQITQKARLRRLGDNECPLVLALHWSSEGQSNKRLVLQENDGGDIQWEAFSLPELSNFLRILDREEEEYRNQIRDKYSLLRRRLEDKANRCPQNS